MACCCYDVLRAVTIHRVHNHGGTTGGAIQLVVGSNRYGVDEVVECSLLEPELLGLGFDLGWRGSRVVHDMGAPPSSWC